jgi:hypothetical protein
MPQPILKVVQGVARDFTWQTPNGDGTFGAGFASTDVINAKVFAGGTETTLATPTVIWGGSSVTPLLGAPISLWTVQFNQTDTAALTPGLYRCQVFATHGARTGCLFDGLLEVIDTAASSTDGDLITFTYAETLLAPLRLKPTEREMLWPLKAEASDAIRKWCGQRDFTRQTYTEEYIAALNGYVSLRQMPVNNVLRIRGYQQTVLSITGNQSSFAQAWVSFTTSGDWYTNTLVFTGLVLNSVNNGVLTSTPFLYANYPTVTSLAAAVSAVAGWTVLTTPAYGAYPSTDLSPPGGLTAQGGINDDGCELLAYTEDLTACRIDNARGMMWVGRHRISSNFGQRWGEDWEILEGSDGPLGRVQVTYDAGFSIIPTPIQEACAELVAATIQRLRKDQRLGSEENGVYKYTISVKDIAFLPYATQSKLALYRITRG